MIVLDNGDRIIYMFKIIKFGLSNEAEGAIDKDY